MAVAHFSAGFQVLDELQTVSRTWETLRLIASQPVIDAAAPIHAAVLECPTKSVTNPTAFVSAFNTDMGYLLNAIRSEIGVQT